MATTIQTIETPRRARALDTSGNNNHGQIYSGRALEFDGVTDYFQHNGGTNITGVNTFDDGSPWTFACWMYFNSDTTTEVYFVGEDEDTKPHLLKTNDSSGVELRFREDGTGDYYKFTTGPYPSYNTWYRVVVTTDGTTMTAYINGVLFGSFTKGDASTAGDGTVFSTTKMHFTGWGASYATGTPKVRGYHFDGMMSDGQVWDAAWTADDVSYDYLNPESLVLNRGGTSLTNSNLKIWYPMQDGHRGNQSYILDASNTGLGDELIVNGDFSDGLTGWTVGSDSAGTHEVTSVSGGARFLAGDYGTVMTFMNSATLVAGVTYKLVVVIYNYNGSNGVKIDSGSIITTATFASNGTHEYYLTPTGTGTLISFYRNGSNVDLIIESVSLKPVNDKNNATTVFYGDELIASDAADNRTFDNDTGNWAVYDGAGNATAIANVGNKLQVTTTTDNADEGATLAIAHIGDGSTTSIVAGRSYRVSMDLDLTTPSSGTFAMNMTLAGDTVGAFNITTTETTYTKDFVAQNNTGGLFIYNTSSTNTVFTVDNVSVKEIGIASGWTDADQQLHIPQTALQSYNELAWFEGGSQRTTHDNGFTPGDNTTVAFWVFLNGPDGENKGLFNCISWNSDNFRIIVDPSNRIAVQIASSGVTTSYTDSRTIITKGKWIHVCATIPKATSSTGTIYINGEGENYTTSTTMATASRNINFLYGGGLTQEYVPGSITEMSIWNAILTQAEVKELYNDGKALDALIHSNTSNLTAYWRNNGLNTWTDLKGSDDGTITCDETMLIPRGLDNRDSQGFIMNRQRNTSSLNFINKASLDENALNRVEVVADFVDLIANGASTASIECWVKANGEEGSDQYATFAGERTSNCILLCRHSSTERAGVLYRTGGVNRALDGTGTNVFDDNWHHIAFTFGDGDGVGKLYVNGTEIVTATNAGETLGTDRAKFYVGGGDGGQDRNFNGMVDGVRVYSDALSSDEVKRNYDATKASHTN